MKIPEIVLKVSKGGRLELSDEFGQISCPYDHTGDWAHPCGSWCPHFEISGHAGGCAFVTLWCTAHPRGFGALRVVEPEAKLCT